MRKDSEVEPACSVMTRRLRRGSSGSGGPAGCVVLIAVAVMCWTVRRTGRSGFVAGRVVSGSPRVRARFVRCVDVDVVVQRFSARTGTVLANSNVGF